MTYPLPQDYTVSLTPMDMLGYSVGGLVDCIHTGSVRLFAQD